MLSKSCEYSLAEWRLIRYFDMEVIAPELFPGVLYQAMAIRAFLDHDESVFADALRCVLHAMNELSPKRLTPEFDALIYDALEKDPV